MQSPMHRRSETIGSVLQLEEGAPQEKFLINKEMFYGAFSNK
jgi:hypothetical protein